MASYRFVLVRPNVTTYNEANLVTTEAANVDSYTSPANVTAIEIFQERLGHKEESSDDVKRYPQQKSLKIPMRKVFNSLQIGSFNLGDISQQAMQRRYWALKYALVEWQRLGNTKLYVYAGTSYSTRITYWDWYRTGVGFEMPRGHLRVLDDETGLNSNIEIKSIILEEVTSP